MGVLSENILLGSSAAGDYEIANSCRFEDGSSAYLSRTPGSAGNRKTWTWAGWVKRGNLGTNQNVLHCYDGSSSNRAAIRFSTGDKLEFDTGGSGSVGRIDSDAVYRDSGAWYHIVAVMDTSNATATDRQRLYVNGSLITVSVDAQVGQNFDGLVNTTNSHEIGSQAGSALFDGYLSEVHFIDGQALGPENFGETDDDYGHWKPIKYTGTYGTNGFYLDFKNASSLGNDAAGSNNWTTNNLSSTDQMLDSPTNNFATLNPIMDDGAASLYGNVTYSEGNTKADCSSTTDDYSMATFGFDTGKWYWEIVYTGSANTSHTIGCFQIPFDSTNRWQLTEGGVTTNLSGGTFSGWSSSDVIGVALDAVAGSVSIYINGSLDDTATIDNFSGFGVIHPVMGNQAHTLIANFGQDSSFAGNKTAQGNTDANGLGDFFYTPPSGYLALCTKNLPDPAVKPSEHFNTVLYSGNGSTQSITGVGFQPDWSWIRERPNVSNHYLFDVTRGALQALYSDLANAENTVANSLTSFDSDGFSLGSQGGVNQSSQTYVAWNWKANGSGVSNTDGSITSTVSANTSAGFSIVSYTGNGSSGTVGHGLSSAPEMIIVKERAGSNSWDNWTVGHNSLGWGDSTTLQLNTTSAKFDGFGTTPWNNTNPTSSVFSVKYDAGAGINGNGDTFIAYCFHSVEGYSKFGSYTGNGSTDGPFVYCGFRPAFVILKRTDAAYSWSVYDNTRDPDNVLLKVLYPDTTSAEGSFDVMDFTATGFKLRSSSSWRNASGGTYIFMAFAEVPTRFANAR